MILEVVKVYLLVSTFRLLYLLDTAALNHALKRPTEESAPRADKSLLHGGFPAGAIRQESDDPSYILVRA